MHHLLNTQSDQFRNFDFHQTVKYEILLMTRTEQILMNCKGIIKNYSKLIVNTTIHFFTTFSILKLLVLIIDTIFITANLFKTLFR